MTVRNNFLPFHVTMKLLWAIAAACFLGTSSAFLSSCSTGTGSVFAPMTQAQQQAMTPDQALARLVEGNKRFTMGQSLHRDYVGEAKASSTGQYPFATVLSCIDSRSIPEIIFDQGIGDLFVSRVAGSDKSHPDRGG